MSWTCLTMRDRSAVSLGLEPDRSGFRGFRACVCGVFEACGAVSDGGCAGVRRHLVEQRTALGLCALSGSAAGCGGLAAGRSGGHLRGAFGPDGERDAGCDAGRRGLCAVGSTSSEGTSSDGAGRCRSRDSADRSRSRPDDVGHCVEHRDTVGTGGCDVATSCPLQPIRSLM